LATVTPVRANPGIVVSDMNVGGVTATDMANALVGSGVTVSGATFTGNKRAGGKFSGGAPSIGFDNGIILDSGKVQTYSTDGPCSRGVEGPNTCYEQWSVPAPGGGPGSAGGANSTAFGTPGDADLTALAGFPTFDAAILEFDFVPQFGTVQFQYVFSSEEYSDYSNTPFNDVFGFFINGTNCALVPVTNQPVSINTINNGNDVGGSATPHNAQFFRDNVRPKPTLDTQMDGLTTILTCSATVKAGVTNHMKLAIADASDAVLDSAVFLKGGSLISGIVVTTNLKGGGQSGPIITVPQGTQVIDSATLSGANASTAGGTVAYTVYSDPNCAVVFASAGTVTVTNGTVPDSNAVTMSQAGNFYWQAKYSGDMLNNPSTSQCGSEVVTVIVVEPQIKAQGVGISATEGQAFVGTVATFTDADLNATAGEYSATIKWGDGSPIDAGTVSGGFPTSPGNFTVTGKHIYAEEGSYQITVVITDVDTPSNNATALSNAKVADASLSSTCTMPPVITPGFVGSTASFRDTSSTGTLSDFSATINWGDGSPTSTGTIAGGPGLVPYDVSGSHTYSSTGTFTVTTTINDIGGSSTVATCKVLVAAFPTANGGTFVVGDLEATGPTAPLTWWSSQWAKINQMSGGPAPSSMKGFSGFEDMPLPSPLPPLSKLCGMTWTTDTGNSTPPPPSVPSDMLVIVSTHIVQNGSVISGDIKQLIVVHNNPGYQPNPGSPGTGTEITIVCTAP
jgi:hypothetical protein